MEHIDNMDELKNGVGLRAYGQYDPVVVYRTEGGDMFEEMVYDIKYDVVRVMMHVSKRMKVLKENNQLRLLMLNLLANKMLLI